MPGPIRRTNCPGTNENPPRAKTFLPFLCPHRKKFSVKFNRKSFLFVSILYIFLTEYTQKDRFSVKFDRLFFSVPPTMLYPSFSALSKEQMVAIPSCIRHGQPISWHVFHFSRHARTNVKKRAAAVLTCSHYMVSNRWACA